MIPKIIHYCWFGGNALPELEQRCLASWHQHMPNWEYKWWNEKTFDIAAAPQYVRQAYEARKYAFVSDYVRLWALEKFGGLYMDVDFMVYRPFDELMDKYAAFAGYEGTGVVFYGGNCGQCLRLPELSAGGRGTVADLSAGGQLSLSRWHFRV